MSQSDSTGPLFVDTNAVVAALDEDDEARVVVFDAQNGQDQPDGTR